MPLLVCAVDKSGRFFQAFISSQLFHDKERGEGFVKRGAYFRLAPCSPKKMASS